MGAAYKSEAVLSWLQFLVGTPQFLKVLFRHSGFDLSRSVTRLASMGGMGLADALMAFGGGTWDPRSNLLIMRDKSRNRLLRNVALILA